MADASASPSESSDSDQGKNKGRVYQLLIHYGENAREAEGEEGAGLSQLLNTVEQV